MKTLLVPVAALAAIAATAPADARPSQGRGHGQGAHSAAFGGGMRGCPPGLAKKNNGCLPPGQARKLGIGDRLPAFLSGYNVPTRYRDRYRDDRYYQYRYDQDSIYRVNRSNGLIDSVISVLGL